ncbi:MAG: glutamate--tRNA ligase [Eubacteriales bacterium]|nr:glutamate--tRNA ligase [Eubacteriales bacterium]
MDKAMIRTRFAPSPTGFMHIGNLRTALFEYLVAKSAGGRFILRIEDTDQERYVEGATEKIYEALAISGIEYDEGPDKDGGFGPYVQSERKNIYMERAMELVEAGRAYLCFCSEDRLEALHDAQKTSDFKGYDRHCRHLDEAEISRYLEEKRPFVIRQKMPLEGETSYDDAVFGRISVANETLEDQVLIKSDGFPTYNFANVIDDHDMQITHVVRGCEYLSSTPKYILLYEAFGYEVPTFVHLPLINGKDGHKLSKRHGATSFEDLLSEGYLPEAIINYLALLGWSPGGTQEIFSLEELCEHFKIKGIQKAPAVFDEDKLKWFNSQYLQAMSNDAFNARAMPYYLEVFGSKPLPARLDILAEILKPRLERLSEIPEKIAFLAERFDYELDLFNHKKMKTSPETAYPVFKKLIPWIESLEVFDHDPVYEGLVEFAKSEGLKNGQVMGPLRAALTAVPVSPGGAVEALCLLGRDEALARLNIAIEKIEAAQAAQA